MKFLNISYSHGSASSTARTLGSPAAHSETGHTFGFLMLCADYSSQQLPSSSTKNKLMLINDE